MSEEKTIEVLKSLKSLVERSRKGKVSFALRFFEPTKNDLNTVSLTLHGSDHSGGLVFAQGNGTSLSEAVDKMIESLTKLFEDAFVIHSKQAEQEQAQANLNKAAMEEMKAIKQ